MIVFFLCVKKIGRSVSKRNCNPMWHTYKRQQKKAKVFVFLGQSINCIFCCWLSGQWKKLLFVSRQWGSTIHHQGWFLFSKLEQLWTNPQQIKYDGLTWLESDYKLQAVSMIDLLDLETCLVCSRQTTQYRRALEIEIKAFPVGCHQSQVTQNGTGAAFMPSQCNLSCSAAE